MYDIATNPFNAPQILKSGPTTDHFNDGTRKVMKETLSYFGCKSACAEVVTASVEAGLTTGNRSYAAITGTDINENGSNSAGITTSFSFTIHNFTISLGPNNQFGFNVAGFFGAKGLKISALQVTGPLNLLGASYDISIAFNTPRSSGGFYLANRHAGITALFGKPKNGNFGLSSLTFSAGVSAPAPFTLPIGVVSSYNDPEISIKDGKLSIDNSAE